VADGLVLGPTVLGAADPDVQHWLFPAAAMPSLNVLAQLGVIRPGPPARPAMIDTIHDNVGSIPMGTPKVAGYVTGTPDIQWVSADWDRFPNSGHVRIDQSPTLSSWVSGGADVADVENGAGTIEQACVQARAREAKGWWSFVYISAGNLAALQSAVASFGLTKVQYWVANWNLNEAEAGDQLGGDMVAIQWASPSSNPDTVVPGGSETLTAANVDLSVAIPSWFAAPVRK